MASSSSASSTVPLPDAVVRISKLVLASYVLDWILIIGVAAIGFGFHEVQGSQRPFSLTDPNISYPHATEETVSSAVLIIVGLVAPGVIVAAVTLLLVPTPTALRGAPFALIWRRKIWEWNAAWMGLGVALASTFMATEGLKDLAGKPRPDLLDRCDPDLSKVSAYTVGGLGADVPGAARLVTAGICRNQAKELRLDGFVSFPSGHASFSFAGLMYLSLWLCSKFSISFPYLGPLPFGAAAPAVAAMDSSPDHRNGNHFEEAKSTAHSPGSLLSVPSTSLRAQGAAPPVYLQIIAFVPICVATFIAISRYFDHRHDGFDILFGAALGSLFAYIGFRLYHVPIRRSDGWSWAARSRRHAFFRGIGYGDLVVTEGWARDSFTVPAERPRREDGNLEQATGQTAV